MNLNRRTLHVQKNNRVKVESKLYSEGFFPLFRYGHGPVRSGVRSWIVIYSDTPCNLIGYVLGLLRLQGTLLFIFQCVMVVSLNGFVLIRFALLWNYSHNDGWCPSFLASCLSTTHSSSTKNIYILICYVWLARFHHISHTHGIRTNTFRMEIVFLVGVWSLERNLRREGLGWVWVVLTKPDEGSLHLLHKTRQTDVSTPLIMTRKGHGYRVRLWQIWALRWENYFMDPLSKYFKKPSKFRL